jgi:hypothetical protein
MPHMRNRELSPRLRTLSSNYLTATTVSVGVFVTGVRNAKVFQVSMPGGDSHTFDSFECAIHALAPTCEYCGVKVIGHGVEADGRFFCCAHCASMAGVGEVADRV